MYLLLKCGGFYMGQGSGDCTKFSEYQLVIPLVRIKNGGAWYDAAVCKAVGRVCM